VLPGIIVVCFSAKNVELVTVLTVNIIGAHDDTPFEIF
jgi:hypothetical protein